MGHIVNYRTIWATEGDLTLKETKERKKEGRGEESEGIKNIKGKKEQEKGKIKTLSEAWRDGSVSG